jgi:hypothetical protein
MHRRTDNDTVRLEPLDQGDEWEHLPYTLLEGWVDGVLDANDQEVVEGHTAVCSYCAAALEDLTRYRNLLTTERQYGPVFAPGGVISTPSVGEPQPAEHSRRMTVRSVRGGDTRRTIPPPSRSRSRFLWGVGGGLAVGAAGALVLAHFVRIMPLEREIAERYTEAAVLSARITTPPSIPANLPTTAAEQGDPRVERLLKENRRLRDLLAQADRKDHDRRIKTVRVQPPLQKMSSSRSAVALPSPAPTAVLPDTVRIAFAERRLRLPDLSSLGGTGQFEPRGGTETKGSGQGHLIAPVATRVTSPRPVFSWKSVPGATRYSIVVADADDNIVSRIAQTAALRWQPEQPLPRGAVLRWEMQACDNTGAEVGSAATAFFSVLTAAESERYTRDIRQAGGNPLAIAVVQASAGLWEESEAVLRHSLRSSGHNGGSEMALVRKFLNQLVAERRRLRGNMDFSGIEQ